MQRHNLLTRAKRKQALEFLASGQLEAARTALQQVCQRDRRDIEAWMALGSVHGQTGQVEQAAECFRHCTRMRPEVAEAWYALGFTELHAGHHAAAGQALQRALALRPDHPDTLVNLGLALQMQGDADGAQARYRQALALDPANAEAHNNLGLVLRQQGDLRAAEQHYRAALSISPDYAGALSNLGALLLDQGDHDAAIAHYRRAAAVAPTDPDAHAGLGLVCFVAGQLQAARDACQKALQLDDRHETALFNLAGIHEAQGDTDAAVSGYRQVLAVNPDNLDAWLNLGLLYEASADLDNAIACFDAVLSRNPEHTKAHWNRGLVLLKRGDYAAGWAEHEWGIAAGLRSPEHQVRAPRWQGEPLAGKRLLVYAEQGFGDNLQFVRFLPLLRALGCRLSYACPGPLVTLMKRAAGVDAVFPADAVPAEPFDYEVPLLSLPYHIGTTLADLPGPTPYLSADPDDVQQWSDRLADYPGTRVGIVWSGNPAQANNHLRACPLDALLALADLPDVQLFSLQKGPAAEQLASGSVPVIDLAEACHDFNDTAAAIHNLDLVITVDTAVAHLAGALGRPVWVLLAAIADWRFLLDRTDSPWYPSMRLFRQTTLRDWGPVFTAVQTALNQTVRTTARHD